MKRAMAMETRTVAAADSEWRAVSGNGRRTAVAMENAISIMPQFHCTLPPAPLSNNPDCCAIQSPIMAMSPHRAHHVACGNVAIIEDCMTLPPFLFWKTLLDRS